MVLEPLRSTQDERSMSRVPPTLRNALAALAVVIGGAGAGTYIVDKNLDNAVYKEYVETVAADETISNSIKIAMVMAAYYESSFRHIGKPYIDKVGAGQPITVCNGITNHSGFKINPNKMYTVKECFDMEKTLYIRYENILKNKMIYWDKLNDYQKATFMDFTHNKGIGNLNSSTMLKKANRGDIVGACKENTKWVMGTINGVKRALPGLVGRAGSNAEICEEWKL